MSDFTRVERPSLAAARQKLRKLTREIEEAGEHNMLHSVYKVGEFLGSALPDAWEAAEDKVPDFPPEPSDA